jgi:prolipoprotein diacylglyceryltransferase
MLAAIGVFLLARRCVPPPPGVAALPRRSKLALLVAGFTGGVLGAKLPFLGSDGPAWGFLADGKTITTGLIGAYLSVEVAKLFLGVTVKTGDAFALPLALAVAVGRWGCFLNGCCFGTPTDLPWGVDFGDGVLRHPTQVYESLFHLAAALGLFALYRYHLFPGHRLQLYLIAYAVFRILTEFLRPEPVYALGLTWYQWAAIALGVGLTGQWIWEAAWWRGRRGLPSR